MNKKEKNRKFLNHNFFTKNNRGAEKYLSPFWLVILAIVAGGLFAMVYIFYGTPYDIRDIEANVLINQVADCVSYTGRIDMNLIYDGTVLFQKSGADFLKDCHLTFDTTEWKEQQYYTEINFYNLSDLTNSILSIKAGNNNWLADCAIQESGKKQTLPQCAQKSFYSLDNAGNKYIIKILTIVRKSEKNVKL
jgi:hypothetical protein